MSTDPECRNEAQDQRLQIRVIGVGLLLLTGIAYSQVRRFEFVDLDDGLYVTENPYVLSGLSFENVAWAFTTRVTANWHPLTWLSLMLDVQLFGPGPGAMHVTNVLLHAGNGLLLFAVLRLATGRGWRSGFVAILFAVHPLHVESVAWISERKDVLSTFFGFLAMWWYVRYARDGRRSSYWACLAIWICSLMSKPMFVTLPFVFLLLDYWPLGRVDESHWKASGRRLVAEKIPMLVVTIVFCFVAFAVQYRGGAIHNSQKILLLSRIANAAVVYVIYLVKMLWPSRLAAFYPHPENAISVWQALGASCLLALASLLAIRKARSCPFGIVGWLWYLGTLVPVIGLVQIGDQQMADRYTYLPLIGLFVALTWGVADVASQARWQRRWLFTAAAIIAVALTLRSRQQAATWRDSEHLFAQAIEATGPNAFAEDVLGKVYRAQGRHEAARRQFERALAIDAHSRSALRNLGKLKLDEGKNEEALEFYVRALAVDPRDKTTRIEMAGIFAQMGNIEEAIRQCQEALHVDPLDFYAHHNLGNIMRVTGQKEEALRFFQIAARIDPRSALAKNSLGSALADLGRVDEAAASFRSAIQLNPRFAPAHSNLGTILHGRGNFADALDQFRKAVELDPENHIYRQNLAAEFVNVGTEWATRSRLDEAIEYFRNAVRLVPGHLDANYRLARALSQNRQFQEAAEFFEAALALDSTIAEIHLDYALVLRELGRREMALEQVQEALRLRPDFQAAQGELRRLTQGP